MHVANLSLASFVRYLFRKVEEKVEFSSPSLTVLVRQDLSGRKFGGFDEIIDAWESKIRN